MKILFGIIIFSLFISTKSDCTGGEIQCVNKSPDMCFLLASCNQECVSSSNGLICECSKREEFENFSCDDEDVLRLDETLCERAGCSFTENESEEEVINDIITNNLTPHLTNIPVSHTNTNAPTETPKPTSDASSFNAKLGGFIIGSVLCSMILI